VILLLAATATWASEAVPSEELIVWADPFARWERRWHVQTEVDFAPMLLLLAERNHATQVDRLQVSAVLDCSKDIELLGHHWEVNCVVEDLSLVALVQRPGSHDLDVLQQADAALTGARLQLQVTAEGGVANVDLEGIGTRNSRDRQRVEALRQVLSRVILPFHLGLPQAIYDGARWQEYNSRLMTMPSSFGSGGSTRLAHFLDAHDGMLLVQTIGEGTLLPTMGVDSMSAEPGTGPDGGMFIPRGEHVDAYEVAMHGVAVFDRDTGIMTERVWSIDGGLSAGSPNRLRGLQYAHRGRLRLLGQGESPDLGATLVARPAPDAPGQGPLYQPMEL